MSLIADCKVSILKCWYSTCSFKFFNFRINLYPPSFLRGMNIVEMYSPGQCVVSEITPLTSNSSISWTYTEHGLGSMDPSMEIAPVKMRYTGGQGMKLADSYLLLTSGNSGLLWDRAPINGKTTNSF